MTLRWIYLPSHLNKTIHESYKFILCPTSVVIDFLSFNYLLLFVRILISVIITKPILFFINLILLKYTYSVTFQFQWIRPLNINMCVVYLQEYSEIMISINNQWDKSQQQRIAPRRYRYRSMKEKWKTRLYYVKMTTLQEPVRVCGGVVIWVFMWVLRYSAIAMYSPPLSE